MKREQATAARRRLVLDAALELYQEGGEAAITIEALATRSATSVGSLYHHYQGKEGILIALYQQCLEDYRESSRQALSGVADAETLVKRLVKHYLLWVEEHPGASRLLFRERHSQALGPADVPLRGGTLDFLQEVQRAVRDGELQKLPAALYQPIALGPTVEFCRQWLSGRTGRLKPSEASDALAEAAWRALRP
ncbi:hypothetical protein ABS71_21450 [bacterium SCN 62-11]|nr:TetR/AcrR family transcriptional regulator [Candidatus Eremiobacteraeota bacterium]ODT56764.1 MAG: hypothetical protein ABS71_21450 [bacterium SCN 62-11]